jgi:hypothetical protein
MVVDGGRACGAVVEAGAASPSENSGSRKVKRPFEDQLELGASFEHHLLPQT